MYCSLYGQESLLSALDIYEKVSFLKFKRSSKEWYLLQISVWQVSSKFSDVFYDWPVITDKERA